MIDLGITSADQMGQLWRQLLQTLCSRHLKDTGRKPDYYDFIMTGDLGKLGAEIFVELSSRNGIAPFPDGKYNDGGIMIFEGDKTVGMGGSGCGCSASVLYGYIAKRMAMKELKERSLPFGNWSTFISSDMSSGRDNSVYGNCSSPGDSVISKKVKRCYIEMLDIISSYVIAFVIGGLICVIGQLILDLTTLTAGQILVIFFIVGAVLSGLGIYEPFLNFAGSRCAYPRNWIRPLHDLRSSDGSREQRDL